LREWFKKHSNKSQAKVTEKPTPSPTKAQKEAQEIGKSLEKSQAKVGGSSTSTNLDFRHPVSLGIKKDVTN